MTLMSGNTDFKPCSVQGFLLENKMQEQQIHKEVRWAVWLTLLYLVGWALSAYLLPTSSGWLGFPFWFEMACLYLPLLLIVLVSYVVKYHFKAISLEADDEK